MSQNAIQLPTSGTLPGATGIADMNAAYQTLATLASGASAPTASGLGLSATAGILWHDTTNNLLKIRNLADSAWIILAQLDETNNSAVAIEQVSEFSTSETISGSNHTANFIFTGSTARTLTFARGNTLWNGFGVTIYNTATAALTLAPNAADQFVDSLNHGTNTSVVVPPGYAAHVVSDGASTGTWWFMLWPAAQGSGSIASAATTDLGSVGFENVTVTGTTAITSLGSTAIAGQVKRVTFSGALTLTYNSTSLILPGGASIATAAGDVASLECLGSGNWRCLSYQPASGQSVTASYGGAGYVNRFRNPGMSVVQRGTSGSAAASSLTTTADGWILLPSGAGVTWAQAGQIEIGGSNYSLQITGAASNTDVLLRQRIESDMAAPLTSRTVTVRFFLWNYAGGASITPTLTVRYANTTDNFSTAYAESGLNSVNMQTIANGASGVCAYTFVETGHATTGLSIDIDFGALGSGDSFYVSDFDIRVTPGAATGIQPNAPAAELRPLAAELALCQRYYVTSYGNGVAPGTATANGAVGGIPSVTSGGQYNLLPVQFPVQMRANPSISWWDVAGNASRYSYLASGSFTSNIANGSGGSMAFTYCDTGFTAYPAVNTVASFMFQFAASAEL